MSTNPTNMVECRECGQAVPHFLVKHLPSHTVEVDGRTREMTVDDYLHKYPGAPTISSALASKLEARTDPALPRPGLLRKSDITVPIAGIRHRVRLGTPRDASLPLPAFYVPPVLKQAGKAMYHLSVALTDERAIYIHGPTGSGKDAAVHYFSAVTQRPTMLIQIIPKVDLRPWISVPSLRDRVMTYEDGPLVKALRDGYGPDKVPYLILFTDIDRAEADQLEYLRMMLDSISGRIMTCDGKTHLVLPDTQFVATANTVGMGDGAAQYVSAKPQDVSILGRFPVKIQWFDPEIEDVMPTIQDAYPDLSQGQFFQNLRRIMQSLRSAGVQTTQAIFSMRDAFAVCNHARRLIRVGQWNLLDSTTIILGALRVWLGGLADDQRIVIRSVLQTHFPTDLPAEENMP